MSQEDMLMEELIDSEIEGLIQDDSYYNLMATPLKPASAVKQAHRNQLREFFKLKELRSQLDIAQNLILNSLPNLISAEEFDKVKSEIDGSAEHFIRFIETMSNETREKPVLLQEMFGLSNATLLHAYALGSDLVKEGNIEGAYAIFVFLATLAPYVTSYWIAQGVCLKALNRNEEALAVFDTAKFLNPLDPTPSYHVLETYMTLKENAKAKIEFDELKLIIDSLEGEKKEAWVQKIKNLRISS